MKFDRGVLDFAVEQYLKKDHNGCWSHALRYPVDTNPNIVN